MATFIYARVSTEGQTVESQLAPIIARFPGATVIEDVMSGAKDRPVLNSLIARLQPSDTLVVAGLDRLGRKAAKLIALIDDLNSRQINLVSCREGVDFSTPVGKMVAGVLASVAELERELISDRTKAGLIRARAEGKRPGRVKGVKTNKLGELIKPSTGRPLKDNTALIIDLKGCKDRGMSIRQIAYSKKLSVGRVHQLLKAV